MEKIKFKHYEHRPCKFVFRNGKKVFGVIWEARKQKETTYMFASAGEFEKIQRQLKPKSGFPIRIEDLIHAELLY
ncbi:MAG: hypothetical protein ACI9U0_002347 [Flavobacteriales bacterium]|jgi:hypothetical protein|tara:strand:+ start:3217 stop:3441 length:225 start_codon:yes stop_codon:yes gene_type:complete